MVWTQSFCNITVANPITDNDQHTVYTRTNPSAIENIQSNFLLYNFVGARHISKKKDLLEKLTHHAEAQLLNSVLKLAEFPHTAVSQT